MEKQNEKKKINRKDYWYCSVVEVICKNEDSQIYVLKSATPEQFVKKLNWTLIEKVNILSNGGALLFE